MPKRLVWEFYPSSLACGSPLQDSGSGIEENCGSGVFTDRVQKSPGRRQMKKPAILLILLTLATLSVALTGCGATNHADSDKASLTMRTYTVPASRAENLSDTLNHVLRMDNDKQDVGRAWVAGPGQILVLAPARMQASIGESLKAIVGDEGAAPKPQPLRLNAWVVDAYPGRGPDDASLKTIKPALEAFAADMGPSHFVGVHYLTAVSDAGERTDMQPSMNNHLFYTISKSEGGLVINFNYAEEISSNFAKNFAQRGNVDLHGQVTTKLGQTLVLGLVSERPDRKGPSSIHRLLVIRIVPANQG
jgi:hypothetical protein